MDKPQTLGERIRYYRLVAGLTQKELGASCDLQSRYVSNLECGNKRNPCINTLKKLAVRLDVSLDTLVNQNITAEGSAPRDKHLKLISSCLHQNPEYLPVIVAFAAYLSSQPNMANARRVRKYLLSVSPTENTEEL